MDIEGNGCEAMVRRGRSGCTCIEWGFLSPVSTEELSVLGIEENRSKVILTVDGLSDRIGAGHQADLTFHAVHKEQVLQVPSAAIVPDTDGDAAAPY